MTGLVVIRLLSVSRVEKCIFLWYYYHNHRANRYL